MGCTAEHTSCLKPGNVSSFVRAPPPGVSAASITSTFQPLRARWIAAASPLGPEPTMTASSSVFDAGFRKSSGTTNEHECPRINPPLAQSSLRLQSKSTSPASAEAEDYFAAPTSRHDVHRPAIEKCLHVRGRGCDQPSAGRLARPGDVRRDKAVLRRQ